MLEKVNKRLEAVPVTKADKKVIAALLEAVKIISEMIQDAEQRKNALDRIQDVLSDDR